MSCRDTGMGVKNKLNGQRFQKYVPGEEVYGALERKDSEQSFHQRHPRQEECELPGGQ